MTDFQTISNRLGRGSFLQEDMDALGMSGFVDVFQMRTALVIRKAEADAILAAEEAKKEAAAFAAAEAIRVQQALENFNKAQAAAEEYAKKLAEKQAAEFATAKTDLDKFKQALASDPNVKVT